MKSNKQVALIVKEDGLIYVNEVPEEPRSGICSPEPRWNCYQLPGCICAREWNPYRTALASAKETAILCVDQEKAHGIIWRNHASQKDRQQGNALKPGIYPIPDLQWEVKEELEYPIDHTSYPPYRQVAILKESTPSTEQLKDIDVTQEEESQDELWKQARHLIEIWDIDGLFKQFIITRKP